MNKQLAVRLATIVLTAAVANKVVHGHPGHYAPSDTSSHDSGIVFVAAEAEASPASTTTPAAADLGRQRAFFCYELLTDVALRCPTDSQQAFVDFAYGEHQIVNDAPHAPSPDGRTDDRSQLFEQLAKEIATVSIAWSDDGPRVASTPRLKMVSDLPRGLICHVSNETASAFDVTIEQSDFAEGTSSTYTVLPGSSQPVFLQVQSAGEQPGSISLVLSDTAGGNEYRRELSIESVRPAIIHGRLLDGDTGDAWPGRVYVRGSDGQYRRGKKYAGNKTLSEKQLLQFWDLGKYYQVPFFYSDGEFEVVVPPGVTELTLERGFEHDVVHQTIDLKPGEVREVTLSSKRFVNMQQRGWVSGDTHVHWVINQWDIDLPLDLLSMVQRAEDLRVANNLTLLQRGPSKAFINPQQAPMGTVEQFSDGDYHVEMGEEYRNEDLYGHLCFLNLDWLVMPIGTGSVIAGPDALDYPINKTAILACREQGGISIEAHGLGGNKDVPVNVIHGLTDSLDQIEPEEYYRFLDCGFKLPLTNGSDHPARVIGCARAYVKVDGPFTYEKWIDGIRQCRTFTTSGPLLELAVNDADIGDTLNVDADEPLEVVVRARSRNPIGNLQVVSNGEVLASERVAERDGELRLEIPADKSSWIVARCAPDDDYNAIHGPDIAHTSAVYVNVGGKPRIVREAAEVWISRMRQHVHDIRTKGRFLTDYQRQEAIDYVEDGIARYESLIAQLDSQQVGGAQRVAVQPVSQSSASNATPPWPEVAEVESQPLLLQVRRLAEALDYIGNPLPEEAIQRLEALRNEQDDAKIAATVQEILDPLCIAGVEIANKKMAAAAVDREIELVEQGWRSFLVKVCNRDGMTTRLHVESPNARPLPHAKAEDVKSRWMGLTTFDGRPMQATLSGLELEYRIVQIYSRDSGSNNATLEFSIDAQQGTRGRMIREWRFDEGTDGWEPLNQVQIEARDGSLHVYGEGEDPFIGTEVGNVSGDLLLRFWAEASEGGVGQVFFWTEEQPEPDPNKVVTFSLTPGAAKQYEAAFKVDGVLAGVRIDPNVKASDTRIDWIDLSYAHRRGETWTSVPMRFNAQPAVPITIEVEDEYPDSAMAAFVIRDELGRVYPEQSKRLAPDLFFHPQIYRGPGETVLLPPGEFDVRCWRGPESVPETKKLVVGTEPGQLSYHVKRWIDPSDYGWWSGDHHIHAAGCLHYQNPTQGIRPEDMIRQIMGEDLHVGCCLTWGPCFDFQKRFFTGKDQDLTSYPYIVRYDVEVSGFGSHASGHLNLLRLKEQIYPGGDSKDHWPTLGLNTLRWAKKQGAICGPAHSAAGLTRYVDSLPIDAGPNGLPHYNVPAFDGIGANEYIVDITHELPGPDGKPIPAIDFIATMNTPRNDEWNIWYHTLNCGFRVRASGETDFPCLSGERVGIGRVYVKVDGKLNYPDWVQGIQDGRSYVSDAKAHLIDFRSSVGDSQPIELGVDGSELVIKEPRRIRFEADCAVLLDVDDFNSAEAPNATVELIVNGYPAATCEVRANGALTPVKLEAEITESSWVALRVYPHAHTNPIFVIVDGKPIRASKASAEWCLRGVEQCWEQKLPTYADHEIAAAQEAYEHARQVFETIKAEATE